MFVVDDVKLKLILVIFPHNPYKGYVDWPKNHTIVHSILQRYWYGVQYLVLTWQAIHDDSGELGEQQKRDAPGDAHEEVGGWGGCHAQDENSPGSHTIRQAPQEGAEAELQEGRGWHHIAEGHRVHPELCVEELQRLQKMLWEIKIICDWLWQLCQKKEWNTIELRAELLNILTFCFYCHGKVYHEIMILSFL